MLFRSREQAGAQSLDDYEAEERFTLEWVRPRTAIKVNREHDHGPKDQVMLELLIAEGYLPDG